MNYEGDIYRPPSEAYSLIVQAVIGCAHNDCTFCSMFKTKSFRIRKTEEIIADLEDARRIYQRVGRIFLADGDALILKTGDLLDILAAIARLFPEAERVSSYASPQDVLRKSQEELLLLREAGLEMIYIGAESGSDAVLTAVKKGATSDEISESIIRIEEAGIKASVTFISGLGGAVGWKDHAIRTGEMISRTQPSYVGLLTLIAEPPAPLYKDIAEGRFECLTPEGVLEETKLLLENCFVNRPCVFRSNHASNYLSLAGNLPKDREGMISMIDTALSGKNALREERYRML